MQERLEEREMRNRANGRANELKKMEGKVVGFLLKFLMLLTFISLCRFCAAAAIADTVYI